MLIVAHHDPSNPTDEADAERARLALRAARVRWSVDAVDLTTSGSPFSVGTGDDDSDPLVTA